MTGSGEPAAPAVSPALRVAGTLFALLFLLWGAATVVGGVGEGRGDWILLGAVLAGFGCVFLPAVRYLWQRG